jgi:hypothetical protein
MKENMTEIEMRQILLMKKKINAFKNIDLSQNNTFSRQIVTEFISDLEGLVNYIKSDKEFQYNMDDLWQHLEVINAMAASEYRNFTEEDLKEIDELVKKLENLVDEKYKEIPEDFLWWNE